MLPSDSAMGSFYFDFLGRLGIKGQVSINAKQVQQTQPPATQRLLVAELPSGDFRHAPSDEAEVQKSGICLPSS